MTLQDTETIMMMKLRARGSAVTMSERIADRQPRVRTTQDYAALDSARKVFIPFRGWASSDDEAAK